MEDKKDTDFPFQKGEYYPQKDIRKDLRLSQQRGINYKKKGNFLVLFMNAGNFYNDQFDAESGLYRYTGEGQKNHQTLTNGNERLADSNKNNTVIHFFEQQDKEKPHKYVGLVKLEEIKQEYHSDGSENKRKIYRFLLRPID